MIKRHTVDTSDEENGHSDEETPAQKKVKAADDGLESQRAAARSKLSEATLLEQQRRRVGRVRSAPGVHKPAAAPAAAPGAKTAKSAKSGPAGASGASCSSDSPQSRAHNDPLLRGLPSPLERSTATEQERVITEFVRFHPMCSAIGGNVLQQIANMVERVPIRVPELPIVGKPYEDEQLRPANTELGERSCIAGNECLCRFIARLRYGNDNSLGFTGVEFLLPAQRERWLAGHGLPPNQGKCLVCLRYWTTRLYLIARSDPSFRLGVCGKFMMQTHTNPVIERDEGRSIQKALDGTQELPTHVNTVNCVDGYIPDAMLYADEEFVNCQASRQGNSAALAWKPVVRFDSSHYRYVRDDKGQPRIVQVGIGMDLNSSPPSTTSASVAAALPRTTPIIPAPVNRRATSSSSASASESDTTATITGLSTIAA